PPPRWTCISLARCDLHPFSGTRCSTATMFPFATSGARTWLRETAWPRLTTEQQAIVTTHLALIDQLTPLIPALERRSDTAAGAGGRRAEVTPHRVRDAAPRRAGAASRWQLPTSRTRSTPHMSPVDLMASEPSQARERRTARMLWVVSEGRTEPSAGAAAQHR